MSKTLNIDGVRFESSAAIAERFSYTQDYVGRLAREGKVSATKIGRLWFVQTASFEAFLKTVVEEKEKRSVALREERREERATSTASVTPDGSSESPLETETSISSAPVLMPVSFAPRSVLETSTHRLALAQTVAIVLCGAIVGMLGWVGASSEVQLAQLPQGGQAIFEQMSEVFTYTVPTEERMVAEQRAAAYVATPLKESVVFAQFPQVMYQEESVLGVDVPAASSSALLGRVDVLAGSNDSNR